MIDGIYAVRGATTVDSDSEKQISSRVRELIKVMADKNSFGKGNTPISCILSSTSDITACYPARAARESGIVDCPLFSCLEPPIKGSLPLCVRVMFHVAGTEKAKAKHVYLHGAKVLRPDLREGFSVAIDGPSGAGKSTMAKLLAERLGMTYLDTGAMYRAIGLKMHESGISTDDLPSVGKVLEETDIRIETKEGIQKVYLDGRDVTTQIRQHFVSKLASDFSAVKQVRLKLVEMQRKIAAESDCILDGRDIGTYVLPDADVKFYLTASAGVRAERRFAELTAKGEKCDLKTIEADIISRDYNDMHREFAPLKKADDAVEVVTDGMSIDEVVAVMEAKIAEKR